MPLSLNEIKDRALAFSREWEGERTERAEAQTFWNEFFNVFGISRRRIACFEEPVRALPLPDKALATAIQCFDKKYTLKSIPNREFTGLQLLAYMYAAFQVIDPFGDTGLNFKKEYEVAKKLHEKN